MPSSADTVIDVRSLIKRPGATSSLDRIVPTPKDLSDDLVRLGPQVDVHAMIDSVVEGLLVRGTVSAPAHVACSRCLVERPENLEGDVAELFVAPDGGASQDEIETGYAIVDSTIDIDTLIRDALAEAIPARPLCRPDCAGLCPTCGVDQNVAACDGHPDRHDLRWAALADLQLPDAH